MILTELRATADEFARATDWQPKPEGLCRGEVCVPAPGALSPDGMIDIAIAAQKLGMPLVHDTDHGVWALGSATLSGKSLSKLSSLRGKKVVLVAWSSY